jgi:uncharacterized repeat protein (TIGR01451 family)
MGLLAAIVIILIALIITKNQIFNQKFNKTYKQVLLVFLSLLVFISPLGYYNDAVFAAGKDPCATPGKDGVGAVSSIVNTYFAAAPGSTLNSGQSNTTITLGTQSGSITTVAVGDLLMIMQMQDADINSTNTDAYGDGIAGGGDENPTYLPFTGAKPPPPSTGASGFSAINNAGRYEFVTVTAGSGGAGTTITIKGTGINSGLNYTYRSIAATATDGQRSYQVIRVPQYSSLTLSTGSTAFPWNGSVGGVFAVDVAGQLTLGGTIDMYGKGFRPGAGRQIANGGGTGANTDYRTDTTALPGKNGSKGEGIAGTPKYVLDYFNPTTIAVINNNPPPPTITTNAAEGYPNGSYGRGAPANAGGGSTDGNNSNANDENSGGGGGSNGGDGGRGGRAWSSQFATGAYGGKAFTTTDIDSGRRLLLGGGGGAGTTNNGSRSDSRTRGTSSDFGGAGTNSTTNVSNGIYSSGGAGGGIVMLRANTLSGTGTVDVRGVTGLSVGQDGAGGGGSGGTAYITATSSTAAITVNANGGDGGWATFGAAHGPGGGGGGGVVVRQAGLAITPNLAGGGGGETGANGNTNPPNFDAAGGTGISVPIDSADSPGIKSGAQCLPLLTVTKTTSTPTITKPASGAMTATYTIAVSNASLKSPATNVVISDLLPTGFTYASTTSITLSAGATRPTNTINPAGGDTNPNWGTFTIPEDESVTIVFNVSIPNAQALGTYQNPATATYDDPARTVANGTTTATYNPVSSTNEDVTITAGAPGLNLVKRITAINNTPITGFVAGTSTATSNATDTNWPTLNTQYLRGAIDCSATSPCNGTIASVAPGELLEYTIYFLSNGAVPARNVQLCDRIPANTIFQPDTYGSGNGILLGWNTTGGALPLPDPTTSTIGAGKVALNNIPDADAGQFLATNVSVTPAPAPCDNGSTNPDGAILVRLGTATDVPNATGSGAPTNSYGFIRFQVRVK